MQQIHPVILCGGSGTRLWPRSRKHRPKPFLTLLGERTLFQQSLDRASDPVRFAPPVIVAGSAHCGLIEEQACAREGSKLIVEPAAKNTAAAIALAAHALPPEAVMLVCPSDHHIADDAAFLAGVEEAAALAELDYMVAFGIAPTGPETGYGYIRKGAPLAVGNEVARFVEKPDLATAEQFLASGDYVWNGGTGSGGVGRCASRGVAGSPQGRCLCGDQGGVGRLCSDGEHRPRRGGCSGYGLVGYRQLGRLDGRAPRR